VHRVIVWVFVFFLTSFVFPKKKNIDKLLAKKKPKQKSSHKLDFDGDSITGERKLPLASDINSGKRKKHYQFIRLRLHWRPEMIRSTKKLDVGK